MRRCLLLSLLLVAGACTNATDAANTTAPPSTSRAPTTTVAPTITVAPTTTMAPPPQARLDAQRLWAFPGPEHYDGDVLTFQVPLRDFEPHVLGVASMTIDGEPVAAHAVLESDPLLGWYIVFPDAFDTNALVGRHEVIVNAEVDGIRRRIGGAVEVLAASRRPRQEREAAWESVQSACCTVRYLSESAAARDIDALVDLIDARAAAVEQQFDRQMPPVDVTIIDILWGNGGYAGTEVVVSYLDRDFGPRDAETLGTTFEHELTHHMTDELERSILPWPLEEGIAVYVTGGHFKPEDLASRVSALAELGNLVPLTDFLDGFDEMQHESRYVEAGGLVTYIVDTYGWDAFLSFYESDVRARSNSMWVDKAAQAALGVDLGELSAGFEKWVDSQDPAPELQDLQLSIALQEARRDYQVDFAPFQNYFVFDSVRTAGPPSLALREARDPAHAAIESLIGLAQHLVASRRSDEAEPLVAEVESIVASGRIAGGLASQLLGMAQVLRAGGYELLDVDLGEGSAVALATSDAPHRSAFRFPMRSDGSIDTSTLPAAVAVD